MRIAECHNKITYPLEETEKCNHSVLIPQATSPWSPCILHHTNMTSDNNVAGYRVGHIECGIGTRRQAIGCADLNGNIHGPSYCDAKGYLLLM